MTVLLFFIIALIVGFILRRRFVFSIAVIPFAIGMIISAIAYYLMPYFFGMLEDAVSNYEDWGDAMGAMIIQDIVITTFFYSSIALSLAALLLKNVKFNPANFKSLILIIITGAVFLFVFFNEASDVSGLMLSPSYWFLL